MNETMVTVVGNVANEPELRTTASGKRVVNFRLASTPRYYDKGMSAWRDGDTVFWAVSCWKGAAENIADSLAKGQPVVVYGQVKYHTYEDKNGQARGSLDLEATTVGHDLTKGIATFRKASGSGRESLAVPDESADGDGVSWQAFERAAADAGAADHADDSAGSGDSGGSWAAHATPAELGDSTAA